MKRKSLKTAKSFVWECFCGHIERSSDLPEDCPKCLRVGKFSPVPDDMIEEKEAAEVLSMKAEDYDEDEA